MKRQFEISADILWNRLRYYASCTGFTWRQTGRTRTKEIPDLRGFTPHLRQVRLNADADLKLEPWLLHDLLHIVFYDYVNIHLGPKSWLERERFLESHLASEAFAVLILDYFILAFEKTGTLTVDVSAESWASFQKLSPGLPELGSRALSKEVLHHYLTGDASFFKAKGSDVAFETWVGHEIRYAEKQREYVNLWYHDLAGLEAPVESAAVEDSEIFEPFWELTEILLGPADNWKAYTSATTGAFPKHFNAFADFDKYKNRRGAYDFRLTDFAAVEPGIALKAFDREPDSSSLFLAWQVLAETPGMASVLAETAHLAKDTKLKGAAWDKLRDEAIRSLGNSSQRPTRPRGISAFFLP
ncbi:MAG: hypothetical protein ABL958_07715 [Bdellovibrionia bacterium]